MPKLLFRFSGIALLTVLAGCAQAALGNHSTLFAAKTATVSTVVGPAASFNQPRGCVVDSAGNVYVSDAANNAIRKISPDGKVTTLAGGTSGFLDGVGASAHFNSPLGMDIDAQGNLYVADYGNSAIRKVAPDGTVSTVAGGGLGNNTTDTTGVASFLNEQGTKALFRTPTDLALDGQGNVYVMDYGNETVRKIDSAGKVTTVVGKQDQFYTGNLGTLGPSGVPFVVGAFVNPPSIAFDPKRSDASVTVLYVGDGGSSSTNVAVRKVVIDQSNKQNPPLVTVSDYAGGAQQGFSDTANPPQFGAIGSVRVDSSGVVWVYDNTNSAIRRITGLQQVTTFVGGQGKQASNTTGVSGFADGVGTNALLDGAGTGGGLGLDKNGSMYLADLNNNAIRKITSNGTVTTYAGQYPGSPFARNPGFVDGAALGPLLQYPYALALDSAGNFYVTTRNPSPQNLWKISPSGVGQVLLPLGVLNDPGGVTVAADGTVYVADSGVNNRIVKVATDGSASDLVNGYPGMGSPFGLKLLGSRMYVSNYGGSNMFVLDVNIPTPTPTFLSPTIVTPLGLAIAPSGEFYVASANSHTIVKFSADGASAVTYAGVNGSNSPFRNGTVAGATLSSPQGVALDAAGNLYIADWGNNRVRKVTPDGLVFSVAGTGVTGYRDGPADSAEFSSPADVVVAPDGSLFVTDEYNGLIRKITFQ